jgi:hypothetical protein
MPQQTIYKNILAFQITTTTLLGLLGCSSANESSGANDQIGSMLGPNEPDVLTDEDLKCGVPAATVVVPPTRYHEASVINRIVVDGDTVFFGTASEIYAAPNSGGTPTLVYPPTPQADVFPPFWIYGDNLVVGQYDTLSVLSKVGGEVTTTLDLPAPYSETLSGFSYVVLAPDNATLYGRSQDFVSLDESNGINFWKYTLATNESALLLADSPFGKNALLAPSNDYVYTSDGQTTDSREEQEITPNVLYRIPTSGGAPEVVPINGSYRLDVVGADDQNIYLAASTIPFALETDGIYRVSKEGGTPVLMLASPRFMTYATTTFFRQSNRSVLRVYDDLYEINPEGSMSRLLSVRCRGSKYGHAVTETDLYVAVHLSNDQSYVVRIPLPAPQ